MIKNIFFVAFATHDWEKFWYTILKKKLKEDISMKKYRCDLCGWEYDEALGDPNNNVPPGTKFEDLPNDFVCPMCGAAKSAFSES